MDYSIDRSTSSGLATSSPNKPTFPENILRRIFDLCIRGPLVFPPSPREPRRVFTQVCGKWREIVLSTPTYWTTFDFARHEAQCPNNLIQLAELFFNRSGNDAPLAISFRASFKLRSQLGGNIFALLIWPRAHRVWFLSCCVTKNDLRIFFGPGIRFPALQAIHMAVIWNSADSIASRIPVKDSIDLSIFRRTPLLRQASLRILDGIHPTDLYLPWGQMTKIDLQQTSIRINEFMYIMEQSLLLEDGIFHVDLSQSYDRRTTTLRQISIPRLRQLRIRLVQPSQDTRMFGKLAMPALDELWVEREEFGQAVRDTTIYEPLLSAVQTTVKHLTIAEYSIPQSNWYIPRLHRSSRLMYQDVDGALRISENLTSLFLCPGVFIKPHTLEKLASGELLPFLKTLGISSVKGWDVISMVRKKNLASVLPEYGSSSGDAARRPVALEYLHLFVIGYELDKSEVQELGDATKALCLVCGYAIRAMDVPKREPLYWNTSLGRS